MALTDADRLQMTTMALMRYSVVTHTGLIVEPKFTQNYDPAMFLTVNERLNTGNYYSSPTYSYSIE